MPGGFLVPDSNLSLLCLELFSVKFYAGGKSATGAEGREQSIQSWCVPAVDTAFEDRITGRSLPGPVRKSCSKSKCVINSQEKVSLFVGDMIVYLGTWENQLEDEQK